MDHARIFKGTRGSVAAPHPFEIPARSLSGEFLAPAFRRTLRSPELCPTASDVLMILFSFIFFPRQVLCFGFEISVITKHADFNRYKMVYFMVLQTCIDFGLLEYGGMRLGERAGLKKLNS